MHKSNCYPFCDIYTRQVFHMAQCEQDWEIYNYSLNVVNAFELQMKKFIIDKDLEHTFTGDRISFHEKYALAIVRELFGRRSKVTR